VSKGTLSVVIPAHGALPFYGPEVDITQVVKYGNLRPEADENLSLFNEIVGGEFYPRGIAYYAFFINGQLCNIGDAPLVARIFYKLLHLIRYECTGTVKIDMRGLGLHPYAQRKMARLAARMVNQGLDVEVTTLSDYFLSELNILVMLKTPDKEIEGHSFHKDEPIDPSLVKGHTKIVLGGLSFTEVESADERGLGAENLMDEIRELDALRYSVMFSRGL
jgi:hypothetical protein